MLNLTLIIAALSTAMVYLLAAYGLVVTYQVTGVFNFGLGYQAVFAAFLYWQLSVQWNWNAFLAAAVVVIVYGPLFGLVTQVILFRRRRDVLASIVITLGLGVFIDGIVELIWGSASSLVIAVPSVFGSTYWRLDGTPITANEIGTICAAIVLGFGTWLLVRRSRLGLRMRAVVDDPELAAVTAIPYSRMSRAAWMIGSVLAAVSGVLLVPIVNLNVSLLTELVVDAFAVAAFAGMASLPMIVIGSLVLAYVQGLANQFPYDFPFRQMGIGVGEALPFVMLVIVLLLHPAARSTVRVVSGSMQGRLRARASGNVGTALVLVVVLTIVAGLLNPSWAFNAQQCICYGIVALSLVLLVGASGQISLCQVTLMGLSAVFLAKLMNAGVPWVAALLAGVVIATAVGVVLSLMAFRLRGLFLALVTYAAAYAILIFVFDNTSVISLDGLSVGRPTIFGLNTNNDRVFMYIMAVVLVLCILAVGTLLRGPWGRALQTLGAGDNVASVSGLGVRGWKMSVFAVSAALAGLAGGFFALSNQTITGTSFDPEISIFVLVYVVVGGITTPAGAVIAGFIAGAGNPILRLIVPNPGAWALILFGVMAMDTTIRYPSGQAGLLPSNLNGLVKLMRRRPQSDQPRKGREVARLGRP